MVSLWLARSLYYIYINVVIFTLQLCMLIIHYKVKYIPNIIFLNYYSIKLIMKIL